MGLPCESHGKCKKLARQENKTANTYVIEIKNINYGRWALRRRAVQGRICPLYARSGRICHCRECHPRAACLAQHCGQREYLNDDLHIVTFTKDLLASPPVDLWSEVVRRVTVPMDVDEYCSRAGDQQPIALNGVRGLHAQMKPPAYVVGEITVKDENSYKIEFLPATSPIIAKLGGKMSVADSTMTVSFEGAPPPNRVIVIQFDSMDAAHGTTTKSRRIRARLATSMRPSAPSLLKARRRTRTSNQAVMSAGRRPINSIFSGLYALFQCVPFAFVHAVSLVNHWSAGR